MIRRRTGDAAKTAVTRGRARATHRLSRALAFGACIVAVSATACDSESGKTAVSSLRLLRAPTPLFRVAGFRTSGTYPRVAGANVALGNVNTALREAIRSDQRAYAPYARKERRRVAHLGPGIYRTAVDPNLASASTVVVSALLRATIETFEGQEGGDRWLGVTVRVPSGDRVEITDLFSDRNKGLRVLAREWKRRVQARVCVRGYPDAYAPTTTNYREFALTTDGVVVGTPEVGSCYRLSAAVPYDVLRPYLSQLGQNLAAGVRRPAAP